ncbi:PRC-barrel domain containing protein [Agrobacterium vitis]|uniref:PRC-barrel domain-containing protein n=1 Tax=Agrobacterium vitis TaxID=373 RepID=UPI0012E8333D|nr:PRC-barrel domain-containing protein [Agrobacterium vitis]MVA37772.1 PRC-barrel domain containing protein [Agrobacterium vitis]MVA82238.1 PRC-barrel domain containing protein [Agrobacterium vitis]
MTEIRLQHLIGKQVYGLDGKPIGRIEEVVAESLDGKLLIKEYHLGTFGLLERLSAAEIGRSLLRVLGAARGDGLVIPWDQLDLRTPDKPRLACDADVLKAPEREAPTPF